MKTFKNFKEKKEYRSKMKSNYKYSTCDVIIITNVVKEKIRNKITELRRQYNIGIYDEYEYLQFKIYNFVFKSETIKIFNIYKIIRSIFTDYESCLEYYNYLKEDLQYYESEIRSNNYKGKVYEEEMSICKYKKQYIKRIENLLLKLRLEKELDNKINIKKHKI